MVSVRIVEKPSFGVTGEKTWISGRDNAQFDRYWSLCHQNGLAEELKRISLDPVDNVTGSRIMGISRVEKDPQNRAFDFYIAAESDQAHGHEHFMIPEAKWAVFSGEGEMPGALIDAEMYAFMEWLPNSPYRHAAAPEIEVYPDRSGVVVEFWLPIAEK